ncbi:hypothetical protein EMIT0158MI4_80096 [Burkholderia ambifaria]
MACVCRIRCRLARRSYRSDTVFHRADFMSYYPRTFTQFRTTLPLEIETLQARLHELNDRLVDARREACGLGYDPRPGRALRYLRRGASNGSRFPQTAQKPGPYEVLRPIVGKAVVWVRASPEMA